ncbi:retrotransposon protein, putative, ty1-copia subclass, partial [Tanacetum coccineum]
VHFLRDKNEAFNKFKEWKQLVENQTGKKLKKLQTNNGLEFCNQEFNNLCKESGIARHLTVAGTPQQNGLAERMNRTLLNKVRSPSTALEKKTHMDLWSGHPANYEILRIFGCVAYSHVNQGKLKPRAIKCIFLGYPEGVKGYRLWRLDDVKPKIIINRDVVFNESLMYKDTLKGAGAADYGKEGPQQQNLDNYVLVRDRAKRTTIIPTRYRDEGNVSLSRPSGSKVDDMVAYAVAIAEEEDTHEPITFQDEWVRAMKEEMSSLKKNHTWELVDQPPGQKLVSCKWLYKIKEGIEGVQKPRYKARLVARGFTQRAGIDYNEVFSPVVRHTYIRVILLLTACEDYELEQLDMKMAFLHGNLKETIYIRQPPSFEEGTGNKVCLLKKSLYGLKQCPRQWSPSTALEKKTPMDLWSGHPANYEMLRIFGCVAYSHVNQGKLKPRAIKCIFLGYPEGVKGYRLWRLDDVKPKIIISRDVVFNESLMYKDTLKGAGAADSGKEVEFEVELQGSRVEPTVDPHTGENPGNEDEEQDEGPQQQNLDNYVLTSGSKVDDMAAYAFAIDEEEDTHEPIIFQEAINSSKKDEWVRAMKEEMSSLKKNHTWELIDQPPGQKLLSCKWLYKIKEGIEGVRKPRYKARLVARGFTQRAGIDYNEVFSPVVRHTSIRVILSLTACEDYELEQLDVKTAFLHGNLEEPIYMSPQGSDDMLIACKNKSEIEYIKGLLRKEFNMKELGPARKILGMEIVKDRVGLCAIGSTLQGSLMYLMVCTRPDIAYAVSIVSRYLANPGKHVDVDGFVNADYAKDPDKEIKWRHLDVDGFIDQINAKDPEQGSENRLTGHMALSTTRGGRYRALTRSS